MIEIRKLNQSEISLCLEIGRSFFEEGGLPGKFNEDVFISSWSEWIILGTGAIHAAFNGDELTGIIGGLAYNDSNTGDKTATEMFWYVNEEHRSSGVGIKLLESFESWSKRCGAKNIIMVHLHDLMDERLCALYTTRGYKKIESSFIMEV